MSGPGDLQDFECLRCGECCRLSGYVRVTPQEIARIADYLGMTAAQVRARYVTTFSLDGRRIEILRDRPGTTTCIFLGEENECMIHPVKPEQCRTFPLEWRRPGASLYCAGLRALRQARK